MKNRNQKKIMNVISDQSGKYSKMYELIRKLYPICRSITGDGVRETLNIIKDYIPLDIKEIPSGTKAFDWTVPKEWNIKEAYVKNSKGKKIIDFKKSNLHVMSYSVPVKEKVNLKKLKEHLYTEPEHPDAIPYRTSYYKEDWAFCLAHSQFEKLKEDTYEVLVDSSLKNGYLNYGELFIKGKNKEEILFSCYICHPSLCNDNLSGVALLTILAKHLKNIDLKYSYRFLFIPETIGSIVWLSKNEDILHNIKGGLVATCVGAANKITYKKSRDGDNYIDRVVEKVLIDSLQPYEKINFNPSDGSDERQFCSPGINIPMGSLMRTKYGCFPEYHTSADNLDFVSDKYLSDSLEKYMDIVFLIENNAKYMNQNPKCEPQLGKRGFYRTISNKNLSINESAIFWILSFSDGNNSLLDIALRSGISFKQIKNAADVLKDSKLIKFVSND